MKKSTPSPKGNRKNPIALIGVFVLFIFAISNYLSCKKPSHNKQGQSNQYLGRTGTSSSFSLAEIVAKLPKSQLYNLGDSAIFYSNEAEVSISDNITVVRFPINESRTKFFVRQKRQWCIICLYTDDL